MGAVRHRLRTFVEGDPPVGLQLHHDAAEISMDLTLADFDNTRAFLEEIIADICENAGVAFDDLATEEAKSG